MTRWVVLLVVIAGCGRRASGQDPPRHDPPPPPAIDAAPVNASLERCEKLPFAATIPIAEASGAVWLPRDGGAIVVVSDSGHHGDYVVIDGDDGHVLEHGKLPLGGVGDDVEGLAADGDRLWGITSSGWMRSWKPKHGGGYAADVLAYRIDDNDECALADFNCGHNYEGLCLGAAAGADGCGGYAVAKADGALVCLIRDGDRWIADAARAIKVTGPDVMAACDITADGAVWTGDNLFGAATVRRLVAGEVTASASLGEGFPESMAIAPDGVIYRLSDVGGTTPSKVSKWRCGAARTTIAP
jgi:hypothetical protein